MISATLLALGLLQISNVHDVQVNEQGWMTLGAPDPYVVYKVPVESRLARGVYLKYSVKNAPENYFLEVFFKTDLHGFDSQYRYLLNVAGSEDAELYVPLDMYDNEWLEKLRVDFVSCNKCRIRMEAIELVDKPSEQQKNLISDSYQPLTGVVNRLVLDEGQLYELPQFHINEFEYLGDGKLQAKSKVPFISSPVLGYPISRAAGLYFTIRQPLSVRKVRYVSFSWHTHKYGYRNKMRLRIPNDGGELTELFVPFTALADEKVIHRFRLGFVSDLGEVWTVEEIRLLPKSRASEYLHLVPEAIVDYPGKPAAFEKIVADGFKKMQKDMAFFLVFVVIFVATAGKLLLVSRQS